jgi:microcystin-dependent protein
MFVCSASRPGSADSRPAVSSSSQSATAIEKLANMLADTGQPVNVRIATITAIDTGAGAKVQTDQTSTGWINRSEDIALAVGDRVWVLNYGAAWIVGGRLSGESSASPIGTLVAYAGASAPLGWHLADGSAVSRTTYATAFAVMGTTYGAGDGSTTFNLPNLGGSVVLGTNGTYTRGLTGGAATVALSTAQIPAHDHGAAGAHTHTAGEGSASATVASGTGATVANSTGVTTSSAGSHTHTSIGSGTAHENLPPYTAIPYIVRIL